MCNFSFGSGTARTASIGVAIALICVCLATATSAYAADQTKGATSMTTCLQYDDLLAGTGGQASAGRQVTVHYTGWLQNPDGSAGTKFDSSLDRIEPFVFPRGAGRVIRGWDEGVAGMRVGGKRKLIIPPALEHCWRRRSTQEDGERARARQQALYAHGRSLSKRCACALMQVARSTL